jgi:hypothetical protein
MRTQSPSPTNRTEPKASPLAIIAQSMSLRFSSDGRARSREEPKERRGEVGGEQDLQQVLPATT